MLSTIINEENNIIYIELWQGYEPSYAFSTKAHGINFDNMVETEWEDEWAEKYGPYWVTLPF